MDYVLHFVANTVLILLDALEMAMLVRAILSWFDPMHEWRISAFFHVLTEPVIMPVRSLCERRRWFEGLPIDVPFLITVVLLYVVRIVLVIL